MMNEKDTENFRNLIKEKKFTQESYDQLLKRFDLEKIDLESEYTKIVKKESYLSARQRSLVPDFLAVRDMLKEFAESENVTSGTVSDESVPAEPTTISTAEIKA